MVLSLKHEQTIYAHIRTVRFDRAYFTVSSGQGHKRRGDRRLERRIGESDGHSASGWNGEQ